LSLTVLIAELVYRMLLGFTKKYWFVNISGYTRILSKFMSKSTQCVNYK
jgi:hypothetical protein